MKTICKLSFIYRLINEIMLKIVNNANNLIITDLPVSQP